MSAAAGLGMGTPLCRLWPSWQGWALCTLLLLGVRVTLGRSSSTGQGEASSAGPAQGQTWLLQRSLHCQTSLRKEFNFSFFLSFFQSFFRGHKYLWRACQSSLGFLTECVTREGFLWWFTVNCSKLLSCQGAQRSYTMSGRQARSPGWLGCSGVNPSLPRGHCEAWALLKCHFNPQTAERHGWEELPLLGQKSQQISLIWQVNHCPGFLHNSTFPAHRAAMHTTAGLVPLPRYHTQLQPSSNCIQQKTLTDFSPAGFWALKGCRSGPDISM